MWGEQNASRDFRFLNTLDFLSQDPLPLQSMVLFERINFLLIEFLFTIKSIACNNSISLFLAANGAVYSKGIDVNKYGLLGIGKIYEQKHVHQVCSLAKYL